MNDATTVSAGAPLSFSRALQLLAVPILTVLVWIALAALLPYAVATPEDAFRAVRHGVNRGWMTKELATTLTATLFSTVLSTVLGVGFAIVVALNRFWGDVFEPLLVWLYSVPKIVLYPIVLMIFGLSLSASVGFGVINTVLPVSFLVFGVIRRVPAVMIKVAQSFGLSRWATFREVVIPLAAPTIFTAARLAFCLSFLAVVVAEMLGSRQGLGQELFKAIALNDIARIFGIAFVLSAIAVSVNAVFLVLQGVLFDRR